MASSTKPEVRLAPAVKQGIYSYHPDSGLSVNGVPRCHKTQLREHLAFVDPGPALTKKGKPRVRQPPRPQDQSAEFYRAQMVHYGLATSVDDSVTREAAKVALSSSKLLLPDAAQRMELSLKALYDAENNALRPGPHDKPPVAQGAKRNKRQRDDSEPSAGSSGPQKIDNPDAKRAKKAEPKAEEDPLAKLDAICGSYDIKAKVASTSSDEPYESDFVFNLVLSSTRSHLWGAFDFGICSGVLRASAPSDPTNSNVYFHWCGRDDEVEEAIFGPQNVGTIKFLPGGRIKGKLEGDPCDEEPIKFSGRLFPANASTTVEDVRELKSEYKALYAENFDPDGPGRWGSSSWCGEPAREIVSDTEESGGSGDEDSDGGWSDDYDGFGIRCAFDDY
ncbi:hypothetical protein AURDEDRAFT_173295 [Auricularia subglabra TFB-10046 SS5]|uniref:Uncharacterized protein n=1 Tax=Auricularia subglabra (strain TFB-10046 / SS5) TaxID=717982 RepID=J0D053_AURST|nr:hypothetical protein AURDEDRAFT_173295 [Auricularia subglabra TFB-10046 SS5]